MKKDFVLHVDGVLVNNIPAKFEKQGEHELVITPAAPVLEGESLLVVVRYEDVPSEVKVGDIRTAWVRTADGANILTRRARPRGRNYKRSEHSNTERYRRIWIGSGLPSTLCM